MNSPFEKIVIDKKEERKFRRRALRQFPKEYMQVMYGFIENGVAYVCIFLDIKHTATSQACSYWHSDLDAHMDEAKRHNLVCLGTIHSHPDRDHTLFSEGDLEDSQSTQEVIMGICAIESLGKGKKRRRCHVAYWPTTRPIDVVYKDWDAQQFAKSNRRPRVTPA